MKSSPSRLATDPDNAPIDRSRADQVREAVGPLRPDAGALVVFSDDWGRHPSSSQHLIARLPGDQPIVWVNTIGTRGLRFDLSTLRRVVQKLGHWLVRPRTPGSGADAPSGNAPTAGASGEPLAVEARLRILAPVMWPGFGAPWMRRLNAWLLARQLGPVWRTLPPPVTVLTTLPLVADLPSRLPESRWFYYCVDDFSVWPGYDGATMQRMERDLLPALTGAVAVSETLVEHLAGLGQSAELLTHGVDLAFWQRPVSRLPEAFPQDARPLVCFWGVIDRRMDVSWVRALLTALAGRASLVLIGPQEDPSPELMSLAGLTCLPSMPLAQLPAVAAAAQVLVMPYIDAPVTRAMQPLKLKEYLATGKPVVVRDLPATRPWADACDVCSDPEQFAAVVCSHLSTARLPAGQQLARERLSDEGWQRKAEWLDAWLRAP